MRTKREIINNVMNKVVFILEKLYLFNDEKDKLYYSNPLLYVLLAITFVVRLLIIILVALYHFAKEIVEGVRQLGRQLISIFIVKTNQQGG